MTQLRSLENKLKTKQAYLQQKTGLYRQENRQYAVGNRQRNEGAEYSHRSPKREAKQDIQLNFGHRLPAHNDRPDRSRCRLAVGASFSILTGIRDHEVLDERDKT